MLDEIGITVNKNTIPYDPESPFVTSGSGSASHDYQGLTTDDMDEIADIVAEALTKFEQTGVKDKLRARVTELCTAYPLYHGAMCKGGSLCSPVAHLLCSMLLWIPNKRI